MSKLGQRMWRVGRGQEPWKRRETGGVNDNERHLHHSPVLSPTVELRKDKNDSGSPSRTTAAHKTQIKVLAWSSLVFHCHRSSFYPPGALPWDSRPVSGAGVAHYHLLHRPRSVPTALGPAPLVIAHYKHFVLLYMQCVQKFIMKIIFLLYIFLNEKWYAAKQFE